MSEAQPGGFQPETESDFFSIEGDGRRFFLDKGEKLTENPEGIMEFGGFINFRDADGNEQKFPGGVVDGGDHWLVQRYDDKGDREYRIPKSEVVPEAGRVVAEGIVPVAEVSVGGLEDAAALAAIDAAPTAPAEPVAGPTPEQVMDDIERTRLGMAAPPDEEARAAAEEPVAADLAPAPAPEPQLEIGHVFEPSPVPEPDIVAAVEAGQRMTVAEARQKFDQEFRDLDARAREARYDSGQKNSLQQRAQELRTGAEKARSRVNKLRNKDRIAEAISEEGRLIAEAKKLEEQAAAITALEDTEIQAIEDRRQRARDLTQEVYRWGNLIENPALIEEYRGLDGRMQEDLTAAEKLFGGGNPEDRQVLDAARRRIEERTQARRTELQAMFPRRYMELAGMAPRQDLGDAAVDYTLDRDLIERYYQFADQFYSELTGGPRAVAVEIPQSVEPQSAPELTAAAEVEEISPAGQAPEAVEEHPTEVTATPAPVEEVAPAPIEAPAGGLSGYQLIEGQQKEGKMMGRFRDPDGTVWEGIAKIGPDGKVEILGAQAEETVASEPVEAPIPGQVVVDATEQARAAAARPAAVTAAQTPEQVAEELERIRMEMAPPPAEAVEPDAALTPEQIRERAETRRNNFAEAVAQLEGAYLDTSGTKDERIGRVIERMRAVVLAGLELAEEGRPAQEAVMNVLGRLNNEQNRQLVQAAAGQAPEQVDQAVGNMLRARGAFGPDGKPKSRKELEDLGLVGFIELLLQLGLSFTDASVNAVVNEVQSVTGTGR